MQSTLPYGWYTDPEILRREQERIFRSAWQYVGHRGQLPEPGTFFAGRAPHRPVPAGRRPDSDEQHLQPVRPGRVGGPGA